MDNPGWLAELDAQLLPEEADLLRVVVADLAYQAASALGENLVGIYLTGSFALGAGDIHADVDFLAVTRQPLDDEEERRVRQLHRRLPDRPEHWAHNLEGSYAPINELRERADADRPWLYINNGEREMEHSNHCNTETLRWVLRQHGLSIAGETARHVLSEVPIDVLREEAARLAVIRRAYALADAEYLVNGWGQPYEVLTHCRMLYTASTGRVVGKSEAAHWCVHELSSEWAELLQAAIDSRPNPWQRVHTQADPRLTALTRRFIEDMTPRIVAASEGPLRPATRSV